MTRSVRRDFFGPRRRVPADWNVSLPLRIFGQKIPEKLPIFQRRLFNSSDKGAEIKSLGREGYGEGEPFSNGFPPRNSSYLKKTVSGEEATAWPDCTAPCPAR